MTKVLQTNAKVAAAISVDGLEVEDVNYFIYPGATVHEAGGSHKDIRCRLSIARRSCHSQSCLEVKDVQQAHQAENSQELHDLFSPVWR